MAILVLIHEGLTLKRIPIDKEELLVGRRPDADIYLDDKMASNTHAKIQIQPNPQEKGGADYYIEDLDSTNHTFVNGEKIDRKKLEHDDRIRIGKHLFKFIDETANLTEKTAKLHKSWIPGVYYTKDD